ncbi:MAG: type ISP restriction/modification enzyme [Acidimicrobiales bacterium]
MPSSPASYIERLEATLATGAATEHSYRSALESYIESFAGDVVATNEPKRVQAGAPDYSVALRRAHGLLPIGKVEAKDLPTDLQAIQVDSERATPRTRDGEQLSRYRGAFDNLILTDYLEFRWYKQGELRLVERIAHPDGHNLVLSADGGIAAQRLISDFLSSPPTKITSARVLAERMARLTHLMRDVLLAAIANDSVSQFTKSLEKGFKEVLLSDLTDETFADMFCQTIAYGLFAARVRHDDAAGPFRRSTSAAEIPRSNPFLRHLFALISGPDIEDEPYVGLVDDLVQLLADTDVRRVLRDFGEARHDPIVHFYETFLGEYNPMLRDVRGVYYTPMPVVSYIVRSIDRFLTNKFSVPEGFADTTADSAGQPRVLVLDPAVGTGTFLYEVVNLIREHTASAGLAGAWSSYVHEYLLPRLFGFEIMMAPYAVAHLKLALQLTGKDLPEAERATWAYDFDITDRIGVFLTNALDPGVARSDLLLGEFISDEANAAAHVKTDLPIMVVLGNPPYQGQSMNASYRVFTTSEGKRKRVKTFIGELLDDYYTVDGEPLGERNPKWIQDDYVKFIRFGQWRIDRTGRGVLGFVTNHTYLDAPTFRGMREKLLKSFDDIYVLDLHGSLRRRERNPDGGIDENVFDQIQQGVSIALFVKSDGADDLATVHFQERWGTRQEKYSWLGSHDFDSTEWESFVPASPFYSFRPEDADIRAEWDLGLSVTDIFPIYSTGVVTSRDALVVDTRKARLEVRISDFLDPGKSDAETRAMYFPGEARTRPDGRVILRGDTESWSLPDRRRSIMADAKRDSAYETITYRPFDDRSIFYHQDAVERDRRDVMRHMLGSNNIALVTARSNKSQTQDQFFVSRFITEAKTGESTTQSALFPAWTVLGSTSEDSPRLDLPGNQDLVPNIGSQMVSALKDRLGLSIVKEPHGDLQTNIGPEDVLDYVYAIGNSRNYRVRYSSFLSREWPRIPVTTDKDLFQKLCLMGSQLTDITLLRSPEVDKGLPTFGIAGSGEVATGFPRWIAAGEETPDGDDPASIDRLYINADGGVTGAGQYFEPIAQEVWEFTVGGYQVLERWLRARRGDRLTFDETRHLSRTANAIRLLLELQDEIEELIPNWPLP